MLSSLLNHFMHKLVVLAWKYWLEDLRKTILVTVRKPDHFHTFWFLLRFPFCLLNRKEKINLKISENIVFFWWLKSVFHLFITTWKNISDNIFLITSGSPRIKMLPFSSVLRWLFNLHRPLHFNGISHRQKILSINNQWNHFSRWEGESGWYSVNGKYVTK